MVDYVLLEKYAENKDILFVEDDENIIKETKEFLELIFSKPIDIAKNGKEGIEKYIEFKNNNNKFYDIVITDIQMPIMNGIEFTKLVYKNNKEQLLIVLSAHSESNYLMELVNIGISHFVTKPLNHDEFVHVLYTKLKELEDKKTNKESNNSNLIEIDDELSWNKHSKELLKNNDFVKLTKKEIKLFDILLKYREKTHTAEEILNYLWVDEEAIPDINNLKNIISRLRKKVPSLDIENIYGFGYRINLK